MKRVQKLLRNNINRFNDSVCNGSEKSHAIIINIFEDLHPGCLDGVSQIILKKAQSTILNI